MQANNLGRPGSRKAVIRLTMQRKAVLQFLSESVACQTAMEIFTKMKSNMSDISLSTVYSSLHLFVKYGLAKECSHTDTKKYRLIEHA